MKFLPLLAGLGLLALAGYLFVSRRKNNPAAGAFTTTSTAPAPTRFGFGAPISQPQVQASGGPPSWAQLGVAGINALAGLARDYFQRPKGVPSVAGGRAVYTEPTATTDTAPAQVYSSVQRPMERYDSEAGLAVGDTFGSPYDTEGGLARN